MQIVVFVCVRIMPEEHGEVIYDLRLFWLRWYYGNLVTAEWYHLWMLAVVLTHPAAVIITPKVSCRTE